MRRHFPCTLAPCIVAFVVIAGQVPAAAPARRARPPQFDKSVRDAFFPDAREKLVGERPQAAASQTATVRTPTPIAETPAPSGSGWSQRIAAEVIEDEIKSRHASLAEAVQNPTKFKGGEYQKARGDLSVLAVMFAIAAEYDAQIRWQREAAALRDLVARAGFNCKVGTDGSYQEARARAEDLQTLIRGGSVQLPPPAADNQWAKVADRGPLMKRLERAQQQTIGPLTSSASEFARQADRLAQDAQLIAAIAEVIGKEGYEFADDETYLEQARSMQAQALSIRDAAAAKDYDAARKAAGELSKTCSNCHEGYRS